jgi:hypothetical protein
MVVVGGGVGDKLDGGEDVCEKLWLKSVTWYCTVASTEPHLHSS